MNIIKRFETDVVNVVKVNKYLELMGLKIL